MPAKRCIITAQSTTVAQATAAVQAVPAAECLVIGPTTPATDALGRLGVAWRPLDAYGMPPSEAALATTRWLREWSNMRAVEGRSIKELLAYAGTSLWWFLDAWLVESRYFPPLHAAIHTLDQFLDVITGERPQSVVYCGDDPLAGWLLAQACRAHEIRLEAKPTPAAPRTRNWRRPATAAGKLARFVSRLLVFRAQAVAFRWKTRRLPGDTRHLVVFSGDNWQRVFDPTGVRFTTGDLHFHSILADLRESFDIRFVTYIRPMALSLRDPVGKKRLEHANRISFKPFEAYCSPRAVRRALQGYRQLQRTWAELKRRPEFLASISYRGVPTAWLVEPRLDTFMRLVALEILLIIETAREVVQQERPDVVLMAGEVRPEARALMLHARSRRIPSVSLQHGRFADHHFALTPGDQGYGDMVLDFPLPDRLALYGPFYRDYLVQRGGVDPTRLVVTGAPRWDLVAYAAQLYDRASSGQGLGLDPSRPIILLTTSDMEEHLLVLEAAYQAARRLPEAQLIVKLHPAQRRDREYRRAAARFGLKDVAFRQAADLYELLFLADVLVSPISTTLVDACVMRCPPILVDPLRRGYAAAFDHHPAIQVAHTTDELAAALRRTLFDEPARSEAIRQAAALAAWHAGCLDGRAHQRVADLVQEVCRSPCGSA